MNTPTASEQPCTFKGLLKSSRSSAMFLRTSMVGSENIFRARSTRCPRIMASTLTSTWSPNIGTVHRSWYMVGSFRGVGFVRRRTGSLYHQRAIPSNGFPRGRGRGFFPKSGGKISGPKPENFGTSREEEAAFAAGWWPSFWKIPDFHAMSWVLTGGPPPPPCNDPFDIMCPMRTSPCLRYVNPVHHTLT